MSWLDTLRPPMLDLLWLLLPVAAASGWWAARRSARRAVQAGCAEFDIGYLKGLNLLLNEQPDRAIEVFIKLLEVDKDTVETHLALGNLFRRRGEVDRALHIHQNLIARPTLSAEQHALALFELGQDYLRAGLLDRAEALFRELVEQRQYQGAALRQLLDIYQRQGDWAEAIATAQRLLDAGHADLAALIAHFQCELGEEALARGDLSAAQAAIKRARAAQRQEAPRPLLLQARLARQRGDWARASRDYLRLREVDPGLFHLAFDALAECQAALGQGERWREELDVWVAGHGGAAALLWAAADKARREGVEAARVWLAQVLARHPSVAGLRRLLELTVASRADAAGELSAECAPLARASRVLPAEAGYRCRHCGFDALHHHWQCPGCRRWDGLRPGEESPLAEAPAPGPDPDPHNFRSPGRD